MPRSAAAIAMDCIGDETIAALIDGRVSQEQRQKVQEHLSSCPQCARLVGQLATSDGMDIAFTPTEHSHTPSPSQSPSIESAPSVRVLGGTYELKRLVGAGGMGSVYAARHLRLDRKVAVKLLSPQLKRVPDALERFHSEARIASNLGSRHIVDVIDFNETEDGTPYIVMELLEGEDLAQRLALDGAMSVPLVARVIRQICSALAQATVRARRRERLAGLLARRP
jgi:serine/threonine protein kinase